MTFVYLACEFYKISNVFAWETLILNYNGEFNLGKCLIIYIYIYIYNFENFFGDPLVEPITQLIHEYTGSTSGLDLITMIICNKILYFDFSDDIGGWRRLMGKEKGVLHMKL